jgi:para-nitrobenzyl esterase
MAASGGPNHGGLPRWPAYTADDRSVLIFDTPCGVERDPGARLRERLVDELPRELRPNA